MTLCQHISAYLKHFVCEQLRRYPVTEIRLTHSSPSCIFGLQICDSRRHGPLIAFCTFACSLCLRLHRLFPQVLSERLRGLPLIPVALLWPGRLGRAAASLDAIVPEHAHDMSRLYIWLDLLSIPQRNDTLKRLAVNSLYTHARQADALVIVEPDSEHQVIYLQITAQGELDGTVGSAIWLCMCPATRR